MLINEYRNYRIFPPNQNMSSFHYQNPYMNFPGLVAQAAEYGGAHHPFPMPMNYSPPYSPHPHMQPGNHETAGKFGGKSNNAHLFYNPLQPEETAPYESYHQTGYAHPYPVPGQMPKPPGGNFNSILNSFKSQSGSIDFDKMVNTTGQMVNAITQVSNMVKGLSGIFK